AHAASVPTAFVARARARIGAVGIDAAAGRPPVVDAAVGRVARVVGTRVAVVAADRAPDAGAVAARVVPGAGVAVVARRPVGTRRRHAGPRRVAVRRPQALGSRAAVEPWSGYASAAAASVADRARVAVLASRAVGALGARAVSRRRVAGGIAAGIRRQA